MKYQQEQYLGKNNKTFCMLPWVHSYFHPNGEVRLCCMSHAKMGQLSQESTWEDIWNNVEYRKTRTLMLKNIPLNSHCSRCYTLENINPDDPDSLRVRMNKEFGHYFDDIVQRTNSDGSLDSMDIKHLDIRWSNICNLKCRMCSPDLSSLVAAENLKEEGISTLPNNKTVISLSDHRVDFFKEILPRINSVDSIYFAGGEPLVTKEHYQLLDYLISQGYTNVKLNYNTNFSKLKYDQWDVINLWKQFPEVSVCPSLDSWGTRAEYLRTGTKWNLVEENLSQLFKELPNVRFSIATTVTAFNVLTLGEFLDYMIEKFSFDTTLHINFAMLVSPPAMSINNLPQLLRQTALDNIQRLVDKYPEHKVLHENLNTVQLALTNGLDSRQPKANVKSFIDSFDQRRDTSFTDAFPELNDWYASL